MISEQVLISLAVLVVSGLIYFAGVKRAELRRVEEARMQRISGVVDRYLELAHSNPPETGGPDGLLRAGIAALASNNEVDEAIGRIAARGEKPLGAHHERLSKGIDLLKFFKHASNQSANLTRADAGEQIENIIQDSGAGKS